MLTFPPVLRSSWLPQLGGIRGLTFTSELHPSFCLASIVGIPGHLYNCSPKVPDLMTKQGGAGKASEPAGRRVGAC